MVPGLAVWWQDIEDCREDRKGKSSAVDRGRCYWGREILAYLREKFVEIGRLADKVDQQIVRCYEL